VRCLPAGEKAVVVSSWPRLLDLTARALGEEGVLALVLAGSPGQRADVVRGFRGNPAARVLLLHSTLDCSGLTLTCANHLLLLDPVPSAAVSAQLVGRIARQGQERPCAVYHLVAQGTVEEVLLRRRVRRGGGSARGEGGAAEGGGGGGGGDATTTEVVELLEDLEE
jgi:SNF2 family DNA or RNA helicase